MTERISLEKEAVEFSDANAPHPRIYELPPEEGRALLEKVQGSSVDKLPVDVEDLIVDTKDWGKINVRLVRPEGNVDKLPVIFYIHGAGWVFGSAQTHDKLIRELAVRTNSVVVFPEYSRSDEGEAYARKLRAAGVPITQARFQGIIHDFVMVNAMDQTKAARAAMALSTQWLKED
ncbi:alpha/beta hydrolase fold protein [Enterococcus sp. AZ191]|uniref:alpha/beta hydrolase n=1 Tax=Enterococcus sp. AZ191 TaxID=2774639 RepID=UPI003F22EAC3